MNVILYGSYLASDETARFQYWVAEFKRIEADSAFSRARRAAFVRRFVQVLGFAAERTTLRGAAEAGAVPIDAIVGAVEPRTGILGEPRTKVLGRVPALKRRWKGVWRRLWAEDDLDALPALPVVRGVDGWYLTDLPRSVLVLELLRAKGARESRIVHAVEVLDSEASRVQTGETAASYSLVECERDYDCREHEESKAV